MTDSTVKAGTANGRREALSPSKRALLAMRDLRAELDSLRGNGGMPIAIVGMGCRFPGAPNPDAFWDLLCNRGDGVTEVPKERWDTGRFFHPDSKTPGKIASRWGGFLDGLDAFDASFFGISPREAPHVDPRQRKILEIAWEALEDAGIPPFSLAGSATGVYIATLSNDYDFILARNYNRMTASTGTGTANSIIANRLSYFLDLHGPSLTLDTACSGSLLAIELACRSLRAGESSLAIAGGVSINLLPKGDVFFSAAGALSPTGHCRTFDAGADGIVRSEGAGLIVLKRAADAIEDGDRIYAVIRGGAINHDGASNGIMAPNGEAQKRVLREAYKNAGVSPGQAHFVEGHGTGTPLGDPIEIAALAGIMGEGRNGTPLVVGSLKTNVGHMEAAAGVASVIKAALAMHRGAIPPNREFNEWNPRMSEVPFNLQVASTLQEWPSNGKRRIAGVSAFSFGGANAHLVLEEAPIAAKTGAGTADNKNAGENATFVLPVSAKSQTALQALKDAYREFLEAGGSGSAIDDICYTAGARRSHHNYRFAAVGSNAAELATQLAAPAETPLPVSKLAFVFSGQGSHWPGMGLALEKTEPAFSETFHACDRIFAELAGWSVIEEIRSGERLHQTDVSQAAVFSMQAALAALWRSWGIEPAAVIGQSLGEVAAAYTSGALTLESAAAVVHHRSRLMKTVAGQGKTAVVGLAPAAARDAIAPWSGELYVAGSSSPATSVVSGTPDAVAAMLSTMQERGVFAQTIAGVDVAFHSPHMHPLRGNLEESLRAIECAHARIGMMSTVTGSWLNGHIPDASYWGRNLCEPFQLTSAMQSLIDEGFDGFLEISPQSLLGGPIRQVLAAKDAEALVLGSCQRGETGNRTLMTSLAALYSAGCAVNWTALYPEGGRCVSLPAYPWQRERYWVDQLPGAASSESSGSHPFLGDGKESALPGGGWVWEREIDLHSPHYLSAHKVLGSAVFPGAGYIEAVFAAMQQARGAASSVEVSDVRFHEGLTLSADAGARIQVAFSPLAPAAYSFQFSARKGDARSWTRHSSGKVSVAAAHADSGLAPLEEIQEACSEWLAGDEHYQAMAVQGLEYGADFRAIVSVQRRPGEAIAKLQLNPAVSAEAADYCVHPVLLDAAFQVVAATMTPAEGQLYSTESYVPGGVDRARFLASPGSGAVCVARLKSGRPGDPELCADILLTDAEGRVCVEVEGLRLMHIGSKQAGAQGKLEDWLYDLRWEEQPRSDVVVSATKPWLIFADTQGLGQRVAEKLRQLGADCAIATPDSTDCERRAAVPGACVLYLGGLDGATDSCRFPLALVKTMATATNDGDDAPALWLVTRETQPAGGRAPVLSPASQFWGFAKVVALEHPEIKSGIIDLGAVSEDDADRIVAAVLDPEGERQIAFAGDKCFVPRLGRSIGAPVAGQAVFRADASYVITGGLGGLGLAVAAWMVERGARRIVLVGRTPLPPRSEWRSLAPDHPARAKVEAVRQLERMGASIHTPVFDVGDRLETAAFFETFQNEGWPAIRGVIHAAGVVDDQLMLRLDNDTFGRVLRPKVDGSLALHEATKDLDLDFFTLFSSISSVLGQFGQAHYAAGNAFMDHLAHWRRGRGLPATTINWGPWAEVGLFARLDATDKTGRSGVFPMLPEQALQAMECIHISAPTQAVVVSADWSRLPSGPLLSQIAVHAAPAERSEESQQAAAALLLDLLLAEPEARQQQLQEHLRGAAAKVLRLDPARIDVKEPLTSYGMDSIMVVELRNQIEETMNLNVPMVDLFTGSVGKLAELLSEKLANNGKLEELLTQVENMAPEEIEKLLG